MCLRTCESPPQGEGDISEVFVPAKHARPRLPLHRATWAEPLATRTSSYLHAAVLTCACCLGVSDAPLSCKVAGGVSRHLFCRNMVSPSPPAPSSLAVFAWSHEGTQTYRDEEPRAAILYRGRGGRMSTSALAAFGESRCEESLLERRANRRGGFGVDGDARGPYRGWQWWVWRRWWRRARHQLLC